MTGIEFRINSGVSFGGFLRFMNTSGQMSVGMTGAASNDFLISDRKNSHNAAKYQGDLNKWSFYTDNTERLHINELGNVGINTTNPQAKLDVSGDLRTDSLLEKSKNGSVSGGSYFLIWDSYGNHDIILTQNTEILQGDIPPVGYSQVITLNVIGDFALTLPVEWVVKNGGTYDGVNGSQIVVQSWDNGNFYTVIN
jgi:hypothetical protein